MRTALLPVLALTVALSGCGTDKLKTPTLTGSPVQNLGNFGTTVFIGDSLTAGFQSGSLLDTLQPHAWGVQMAGALSTSLGTTVTVKQPLMAYPGVPAILQLTALTNPPVITQVAGTSPGRDDITVQPTDLAVPGALLYDAIYTKPLLVPESSQQIMNYLVLGFPGIDEGVQLSQVQWAGQLNPTTVFVWLGNNDALVAAETGKPASMTSTTTFSQEYSYLLALLTANTRAQIVLLNIPDITKVPYLTSGAVLLAEYSAATSIPQATLSTMLGVQATDLVNPTGLAEIAQIVAGTRTTPIGDEGSLTAAEQATVQSNIIAYNSAIKTLACTQSTSSNVGITVVDIYSTVNQIASSGLSVSVNGTSTTLTTGFLGGFFSLDGIHPTNTGYAVIANQVLQVLSNPVSTPTTTPSSGLSFACGATISASGAKTPNTQQALGDGLSAISLINLNTVASSDPLVPGNLKVGALNGVTHIPASTGASVSWLLNAQKQSSAVQLIR